MKNRNSFKQNKFKPFQKWEQIGKAMLVAFLILFALTGTAYAKEWTVGNSGADFQTLSEAITAASNNDLIFIQSGIYVTTANISISKTLTIEGESRDDVILDLGGFSIIPKKEDFVLKNVTLTNGSNGINLQTDATSALIENCIFDGMTHKDGIKLAKDGAVFKNNIVTNMSGFTNAVYVTGNNVQLINNTLSGLSGSGNSARIICVENAAGILIEGNTITGNSGEAIRLWKADTADAVITKNVISGNSQKGVYIYNAGENNAVFLNDIFDNSGGNIAGYGTLPENVIFNNPLSLTLTHNGVSWTGNHGNYWGDDYKGSDANGNGIGSAQMKILNVYADRHPLMNSVSQYAAENGGSEDPKDPEDPVNPNPSGTKTSSSIKMETNILPSISVSFSIDSLNFGDLTAGQTSSSKEMRITNSGGYDVIVTAEITDESDDLYKNGIWIDDEFWPDYEKEIAAGETVSSDVVLKVPSDYISVGNVEGTMILWVEAV